MESKIPSGCIFCIKCNSLVKDGDCYGHSDRCPQLCNICKSQLKLNKFRSNDDNR